MNAIAPLISLEQFRNFFGDQKPHYEYWDGEARQKSMPTKLHAKLQRILATLFHELGFYSFTELTLHIGLNWEPIPDVTATIEDFPGPYPTSGINIVIEILSLQDTFTTVEEKCERYAEHGISDILVFDPAERKLWKWDSSLTSLVRVLEPTVVLTSRNAMLHITQVWSRMDSER